MRITLKAARVNKGLTQKKAAELLGISEGMLCKWEKGYSSPTLKRLPRILSTYSVSLDDLIFSDCNSALSVNKSNQC